MTAPMAPRIGACIHKRPDPDSQLTQTNFEPTIGFRIEDAPDRDTAGGECYVKYYQLAVRVPGSERFVEIGPAHGGQIQAAQQDLYTSVPIRKWRDSKLAQLTAAEGSVPMPDGYYDFHAVAIDENGFASEPSPSVRMKLSLTPPQSPKISAVALPSSIVA